MLIKDAISVIRKGRIGQRDDLYDEAENIIIKAIREGYELNPIGGQNEMVEVILYMGDGKIHKMDKIESWELTFSGDQPGCMNLFVKNGRLILDDKA